MASKFADTHFKRDAGTGTLLVEEHTPCLPGEVSGWTLSPVGFVCECVLENFLDFGDGEIVFLKKVFHLPASLG